MCPLYSSFVESGGSFFSPMCSEHSWRDFPISPEDCLIESLIICSEVYNRTTFQFQRTPVLLLRYERNMPMRLKMWNVFALSLAQCLSLTLSLSLIYRIYISVRWVKAPHHLFSRFKEHESEPKLAAVLWQRNGTHFHQPTYINYCFSNSTKQLKCFTAYNKILQASCVLLFYPICK